MYIFASVHATGVSNFLYGLQGKQFWNRGILVKETFDHKTVTVSIDKMHASKLLIILLQAPTFPFTLEFVWSTLSYIPGSTACG